MEDEGEGTRELEDKREFAKEVRTAEKAMERKPSGPNEFKDEMRRKRESGKCPRLQGL